MAKNNGMLNKIDGLKMLLDDIFESALLHFWAGPVSRYFLKNIIGKMKHNYFSSIYRDTVFLDAHPCQMARKGVPHSTSQVKGDWHYDTSEYYSTKSTEVGNVEIPWFNIIAPNQHEVRNVAITQKR